MTVTTLTQNACRNRLLALMSEQDFAQLAPHLEPIKLPKGFSLAKPNEVIEYVYFPETSIASIVVGSPDGLECEAGIVGNDGVVPIQTVMGSDRSIHQIYIQVPNGGYRIERERFVRALEASPSLHLLMLRYAQVLNVQTTFTALSNAVHTVDERLARWLLMCHDRVPSDEIPLTHEFMSLMLAVRRPSVTTSLHVLEGNGFIRAERGYVTIRNRKALEEFARDAYGGPESEYRRLIGPINLQQEAPAQPRD
jgi:CRP-like cAMP-binding protein